MRALLAAAVLAGAPAVAGELKPVADMAAAPWRSLARVMVAGETRCSGFVVSPTQVLTAGHCLYSARLGGVVPASAIHVQVGYHMGRMAEHRVVAEHGLLTGFDPRQGSAVTGLDVAVLRLAVPLAAVPLPLAAPETGWVAGWVLGVGTKTAVAVGGYPRQRPEVVGADTDCRLRGTTRTRAGTACWSMIAPAGLAPAGRRCCNWAATGFGGRSGCRWRSIRRNGSRMRCRRPRWRR